MMFLGSAAILIELVATQVQLRRQQNKISERPTLRLFLEFDNVIIVGCIEEGTCLFGGNEVEVLPDGEQLLLDVGHLDPALEGVVVDEEHLRRPVLLQNVI